MIPRPPPPPGLRRLLAAVLLVAGGATARAQDAQDAPAPPAAPPAAPPHVVVEVPADELEVLLRLQKDAVVLRYEEYRTLLAAARARDAQARTAPPLDAVRLSGEGTLDLSDERAARLRLEYLVRGLSPGPRAMGFASGGVAFESVEVVPLEGAGPARYEEVDGQGRLHLEGPGLRRVVVTGSAVPAREGAQRRLDLWLPNPAAMSLDVTLPRGVRATIAGEGPPVDVTSSPERPLVTTTRPTREGRLTIAWSPAAQGTEGPGVLDADVRSLHVLGGGVAGLRALVRVEVLRTPIDALALEVPADLSVHAVEGAGVTGSVRSEDRRRLTVRLEKPTLGPVELLLQGERPLRTAPRTDLPRVRVEGAVRHVGEAALLVAGDVLLRAVRVEGGRRVDRPAPPPPPAGAPAPPPLDPRHAGTLRYAFFRGDASLQVDLEPVALRVDATSTYYVNLAEPGQTLLATIAYRVVEGTLFRLRPRFPAEFDLRELTIQGQPSGFSRDLAPDGSVEITLPRGVPAGGEVLLVATLERARADWIGERDHVTVEVTVPSAGASREEGYLAVGADAGLEVLDAGTEALVSVGAAELTARGLSSTGLLYGYRLDGSRSRLVLDVVRREPLIEADVVTVLEPSPRRVHLAARAIYRIRRAGVRRLFLDLPSSAGDQVDVATPGLRSAARLAGDRRPADVAPGFERWQIDLDRRAIGTQVVTATWFLPRPAEDASVAGTEPVAARVPVENAQRLLAVRRGAGLAITLPTLSTTPDVRSLDLAEVPAEAALDPAEVLELLRLPPTRDGVEVEVRQPAGAAVLDAIATEVALRTAVAREGILRTRAEVTLVNVERQFLQAVLPPGSALIGAVVDGRPIKPLTDPQGVLLMTVPTTVRGTAERAPATRVVLTYETRGATRSAGGARIEGPSFPGLEILHTTHEIGLEPDLELVEVGGDLATSQPVRRPTRAPWIAGWTTALATVSREALVFDGKATGAGASLAAEAAPGRGKEGLLPAAPVPSPPPTPPSGGTEAPPTTPSGPQPEDASPFEGPATAVPPGMREPGHPAADAPGSGPGRGATRRARPPRALLSLDVPVFLAPHRVVAARVGGGGAIEVAWTSRAASRRAYLHTLLAVTSGLLLVLWAKWLSGGLAILATLLAAAIAHLTLGPAGSTFVAAAVDAATLLAPLLLLAGLLRGTRKRRRRARPTPPPPPAPLAAALLLAALVGTADPAVAEDAPAPPPEATPDAEPRPPAPPPPAGSDASVFVPRDPDRPAGLSDDDRVFVPLAAWLDLQRRAHPDRDPELSATQGVAALLEAAYAAEVEGRRVRGTARFVYARRGAGRRLVSVALPGLAVSAARLDGAPVALLLAEGAYLVPLEGEGDHVLEIAFEAPLDVGAAASSFSFGAPTSVVGVLDVRVPDFDGEVLVSGAGRVETRPAPAAGVHAARAWLGRPVSAGAVQSVVVRLVPRREAARPTAVRTRTVSRTVHSVRDGGTESVLEAVVHVLQGRVGALDVALPAGVDVLEAGGPAVERWETAPDRLRLVLRAPADGQIPVRVRAFRRADGPDRREAAPELAVLETTGESGIVVVNGDPAMRLEVDPGTGLYRLARPTDADAAGPDGQGRVLGAWRFAARPAPLGVVVAHGAPRLEATTSARVTLGDDHLRAVLEARVRVSRAPVGELAFALPGDDELRRVEGAGIDAWWAEGTGESRRLLVRFSALAEGERLVVVTLSRRLGGATADLRVPRLALEGAQAEAGRLVLYALPDVEPAPGQVAGMRTQPPAALEGLPTDASGARPTHAFAWEAPLAASLPVSLRRPEQEVEAVVVSRLAPSDEAQRLEHLVVFDVRRGATDRFAVFVPDGGFAAHDLVRSRDLRELRSERVTRRDADGVEAAGLLYTVHLQSVRSGLVEVTVSQRWPAATTVRVVRPEGVKAVRWFGLVQTFLDGEVDVRVGAGAPDPVAWADLPFVPTGLARSSVLQAYAARAPYTLEVSARRHRLETQSDAVVLSAQAEVVLGRDGDARVRMRYRLFNRARQFLRLRLPPGSVLYGAVAQGRTVKPMAGPEGSVLLPVPKVPLGGTGYEVDVTYRARAGDAWQGGERARVPLPVVEGVEVDRTAVTLRVPAGYTYRFDTAMTPATEREVLGGLVEATLREAREVLEVAQTGSLEQRLFACDNSLGLVQEATRRLEVLQAEGASFKKVESWRADLERLARAQQEAQERCRLDATTATRSEEQERSRMTQGSNASGQTIVQVEEAEGRAAETSVAPDAATWSLNVEQAPAGAGSPRDLVELRGRLQEGFAGRARAEQAKTVRLVDAEGRRVVGGVGGGSGGGSGGDGGDEAKAAQEFTYDVHRNTVTLNEHLARLQVRQGQLGAAPTPPDLPATPGLPPSPDGDREGDGDVRGRPEHLFLRGAGPATTRAGLFGVDVPLPTDGLVHRFVAVRTGSAIDLRATASTTSSAVRVLGAVALWGLLGAGLLAWRRRGGRRRRAPAA